MAAKFPIKHLNTLLYGISLALLLLLLQWLKFRFIIIAHAYEIYMGLLASIFTGIGMWLAMALTKPKIKTQIIEKTIYRDRNEGFICNQYALTDLGLSSRELEVLQLMAEGLSNQEIASRLFVSINTIKTHSTNLFEKMDVKRRTQAISKAKILQIIP